MKVIMESDDRGHMLTTVEVSVGKRTSIEACWTKDGMTGAICDVVLRCETINGDQVRINVPVSLVPLLTRQIEQAAKGKSA